MRNKFLARVLEATGSVGAAIGVTWAAFFLLGGLPLMAALGYVVATDPASAETFLSDPTDLSKIPLPRMVFFLVMMFNFVIAMAGMWAGTKYISKQRFFTLISGFDRIRWGKLLGGLILWVVLLSIYTAVQYQLSPDSFRPSEDAHEVVWWLLPGLLLIPIQSAFEEISIRGQLMQGIGKAIPDNPFVPLLVTSFIFALMHGLNTEIQSFGFVPMMLQYLFFGLFLGAFALMDEGLELSIGIHVGNNLFAMFFVSYTGSSLSTPSFIRQVSVSPTNDLFGVILMFFIVFLIFFGRRPHLLRNLVPENFGNGGSDQ